MKQLRYFIDMFTKITTGTLLICALILTINGVEQWTSWVLWQIPAVGLITALITVIVLPDREFTRRENIIRNVIHFILITAAILACGYWFGWYDFSFTACLEMTFNVALVYAFTWITNWISCKRSADELNKALEKRRNQK